jgi:hypothetical protein
LALDSFLDVARNKLPLDFPGYWPYSGGVATVHLMGTRKPRESIVPRTGDTRFFLYNPDGVGVELNFPKA